MKLAALLCALLLAACTGRENAATGTTGSGASTGSGSSASTSTAGSGSGGSTTSEGSTGTATGSSSGGATASSSSGSTGAAPDPNLDGPYSYAELDGTIASVPNGDSNLAVHTAYPTGGPSSGPYPVIVVGHGFQLPPSQYVAYLRRLASFGYVALTVDFPADFVTVDNPSEARDLIAGIDWAAGQAELHADPNTAGMSGHSLGGKLALLAATLDPRVKASITLDPVDGSVGTCSPPSCVDVAQLMPSLHIPTGFLGETTDATSSLGQACAPAAANFATFYASTNAPSLEVTVLGANHMSFLDDVSSCGFTCSFCNTATAGNAQVHALAESFVVAFYERWLRGDTRFDAYLTGAAAQARYVATGQATITSR